MRSVEDMFAVADEARSTAHDAGVTHALLRHQLAAVLLRQDHPAAAVIVADLSSALTLAEYRGNPSVSEIRDADGNMIDEQDWIDDISAVEEQLGYALDYTNEASAGWVQVDGADLFKLELTT
jgi:hypothetical protein